MNKQEKSWKGTFGTNYTSRCSPDHVQRAIFFKQILSKININSICEIGSNKGANLKSIHSIDKKIKLSAIEINKSAYDLIPSYVNKINNSFLKAICNKKYDLLLTCGFLIHVNPKDLEKTYEKLLTLSNKYILICEYYNHKPIKKTYRNKKELLYIRDFAKDIYNKHNVSVIDHGFLWKEIYPCWDNLNWWLFKKEKDVKNKE